MLFKNNQNYPASIQKIGAIILPTNETVFTFFRADFPLWVHCFKCTFTSGVKWWTLISSMVMNRWKNSSLLRLNIIKHLMETSPRRRFYSTVCKRGTHLSNNFLMSKFSVNMRCTALFEMHTMSASSRTFTGASSKTILWIISPFMAWSPHLVDHCDVRLGRSYDPV